MQTAILMELKAAVAATSVFPGIDPRLRLVFFGTADGDPSDRQLATNGVETDIAGFERHSQRPAGTAQQRCDPCNQLGHRVGAAGD